MATAAGHAEAPAREPLAERLRPHLVGWGFSAPFVALFLVFLALPILVSFLLSFTDFGLADLQDPLGVHVAGLDNYDRLIHDHTFWKAARNTAYFVVVGVPLTITAGLAAAVGLNQAVLKFRGLFRVAYYTPVVTSIVAIAVIWRYLLNPDIGLVNRILGSLGLGEPNWLGNPDLAMRPVLPAPGGSYRRASP